MVNRKFAESVAEKVSERVDGGVEIKNVKKNNDVELTSIIISTAGSDIIPNFYLDGLEDLGAEEAARKICEAYRKNRTPAINISNIKNWNAMKSMVVYMLVSKETNEERLQGMPHKDFLDLAIIFRVIAAKSDEMYGFADIDYKLADTWGVSADDLMKAAEENTKRLFPATVRGMREVIGEAFGMSDYTLDGEEAMFVLSNKQNINGAAAVLYDNNVREIAEKMDSDLVLIPSSIHEWILVKAEPGVDIGVLKMMIDEVNRESVDAKEVLGDHAYIYSREEGEIKIA